jgi:peroxiredoxin
VITAGEPAPDVTVWLAPNEHVRLHELTPPGESLLLLFYLFDWSST